MNRTAGSKPKTIRKNNLKTLLDIYRNNNEMTVADLINKVKLSRTTVMKLNEKLIQMNLINSIGKGTSTDEGGKRPELYSFNHNSGIFFCYYIKYNSIILRIYNIALEMQLERSFPVQEDENISTVVSIITDSINNKEKLFSENRKILGVAVALHAIVDSDRGIVLISAHYPSWGNYIDFKKMISDRIDKDIPVEIESWIRFKAFGEKLNIRSSSIRNFMLIDAGWHGIVSGLVKGSGLYRGKNHLSGEIGHTIVNPLDKEICYCGGRGCLEMMIDCRRLVKKAESLKSEYPDSSIFSKSEKIQLYDIFYSSNSNDSLACRLIDEVTDWFAIGISNACMIYDPDAVFLGGDYSKAGNFFKEALNRKINNVSLVRLNKNIKIIYSDSEEGDEPVMRGSGSFIIENYFSKYLSF